MPIAVESEDPVAANAGPRTRVAPKPHVRATTLLNPDADPLHPFAPALAGEMVRFPDQRFAASSPKNTRHVLILLFHIRVNENTPKICAPFICEVERAANPNSIDAYC